MQFRPCYTWVMAQVWYFSNRKRGDFGAALSSDVVSRGLTYYWHPQAGSRGMDDDHPIFSNDTILVKLLADFAATERVARLSRSAAKKSAAATRATALKQKILARVATIESAYKESPYSDDPSSQLVVIDLWVHYGVKLSLSGDEVSFAALLNRWPTEYEVDQLKASTLSQGRLEVGKRDEWSDPVLIVHDAPRSELDAVVAELRVVVEQSEDRLAREEHLHERALEQIEEQLAALLRPPSS